MGDQNNRRPDAALEVQHQLQNLRLDRDVQRRGRLVAIRSFGLQASEIAIITRWRMPPES